MTIEIHVTDPAKLSPTEAQALSNFFLQIARVKPHDLQVVTGSNGEVSETTLAAAQAHFHRVIKEDDNPATGAKTAAEVFGGAASHLSVVNTDPNTQTGTPGNVLPPASAVFGQPSAPAPTISPPSPVPASVSSIPAPPAAPTSPPAGVVVDARGLPWDGRIHASTKTQTVKGEWKMKKGVDAAIVPGVEAELRAVMAAPVPQTPATPAVVIPPPPPIISIETTAPGEVHAASAPHVPAPPPPISAPAMGFGTLVARVTADMNSGALTQARVMEVLTSVGMPALPSLIQRPDLIPTVAAALGYV